MTVFPQHLQTTLTQKTLTKSRNIQNSFVALKYIWFSHTVLDQTREFSPLEPRKPKRVLPSVQTSNLTVNTSNKARPLQSILGNLAEGESGCLRPERLLALPGLKMKFESGNETCSWLQAQWALKGILPKHSWALTLTRTVRDSTLSHQMYSLDVSGSSCKTSTTAYLNTHPPLSSCEIFQCKLEYDHNRNYINTFQDY